MDLQWKEHKDVGATSVVDGAALFRWVRTPKLDAWSEVDVSDSAIRLVRGSFNPSGRAQVDRIKMLAAALVTELEHLRDDPERGRVCGREAAVAITQIQGACMFAVAAATADLP